MQGNNFYKGVLFELKKLAVENNTSSTPPSTQNTTSSTPSFQLFSNTQTSPAAQNIVKNFEPILPTIGKPLTDITGYISKGTNTTDVMNRANGFKQFTGQLRGAYEQGAANVPAYMPEIAKGPFSVLQGLQAVKQNLGTNTSPYAPMIRGIVDDPSALGSIVAHRDELTAGMKGLTQLPPEETAGLLNAGVEATSKAGFPEVGKNVDSLLTQEAEEKGRAFPHSLFSNSADSTNPVDPHLKSIMDAAKGTEKYKTIGTNAALSETGKMVGDFLTNNWGKIALAVGGAGALTMLLKNMLGNSENQQSQPQQRPTGPSFL